MKLFIASDGWPFFLQSDGTLTDTIDPKNADLGWNSLEDFIAWDEDAREATEQEYETYKNKG